MKLLLKNATVIDIHSKYHMKKVDILIRDGIVSDIGVDLKEDTDQIIESPNLHVSPGWIDIGCSLNDPGNENRESFEDLANVSRLSGYTHIAPMPTSTPTIQRKSDAIYLTQLAKSNQIELTVIGAVSANRQGNDLTEMHDLNSQGVKLFSDGLVSTGNYGILERALQYSSSFGGSILFHPSDKELVGDGLMHQGITSTKLGILGSPTIAEAAAVSKAVSILEEVGGSICLHAISSKESLEIIQLAKTKGVNFSSTVSFHNLLAHDEDLLEFDENLKVNPPLRSLSDKEGLIKGINDDTIDAIISNHCPIEEENKKVEYPYSEFGSLGLEMVFSGLNDVLPMDKLIEKLTYGPAKILDHTIHSIDKGVVSNLTMFDPELEFMYLESLSKCDNSAHLGKRYQGKVLGSILGESLKLKHY